MTTEARLIVPYGTMSAVELSLTDIMDKRRKSRHSDIDAKCH
jgi:hypothetical protein